MTQTAREVIQESLSPLYDADILAIGIIANLKESGFVIAPKEPTEKMVEVGDDTDHTIEAMSEHPGRLDQIANFYRAMIAVAAEDT